MFIKKFTFNAFQENTYIVYSDSGTCVIIDPGCYSNQEESELITFISFIDIFADKDRRENLVRSHEELSRRLLLGGSTGLSSTTEKCSELNTEKC